MFIKNQIKNNSKLNVNTSYEAEPIEAKVRRIINNGEPITDGSPLIYTERKDGVLPGYNIRTDRWETALDAMEGVNKAHIAKREGKLVQMETPASGEVGKAESLQGTTDGQTS